MRLEDNKHSFNGNGLVIIWMLRLKQTGICIAMVPQITNLSVVDNWASLVLWTGTLRRTKVQTTICTTVWEVQELWEGLLPSLNSFSWPGLV